MLFDNESTDTGKDKEDEDGDEEDEEEDEDDDNSDSLSNNVNISNDNKKIVDEKVKRKVKNKGKRKSKDDIWSDHYVRIESSKEHDTVSKVFNDIENNLPSYAKAVFEATIELEKLEIVKKTHSTNHDITVNAIKTHQEELLRHFPTCKEFDLQLSYLAICIQREMQLYKEIYQPFIDNKKQINKDMRTQLASDKEFFSKRYGRAYRDFDALKKKFQQHPIRVLQRIRRNLYGSDVDGTAKAGANVGGGCGGSGRASHKNNATIAGESQDDSGALEDDSQRVHRDVDIEGSTGKEGSSNRGHNSLYSDDLSPVNDLHLMIPTDKKSSGIGSFYMVLADKHLRSKKGFTIFSNKLFNRYAIGYGDNLMIVVWDFYFDNSNPSLSWKKTEYDIHSLLDRNQRRDFSGRELYKLHDTKNVCLVEEYLTDITRYFVMHKVHKNVYYNCAKYRRCRTSRLKDLTADELVNLRGSFIYYKNCEVWYTPGRETDDVVDDRTPTLADIPPFHIKHGVYMEGISPITAMDDFDEDAEFSASCGDYTEADGCVFAVKDHDLRFNHDILFPSHTINDSWRIPLFSSTGEGVDIVDQLGQEYQLSDEAMMFGIFDILREHGRKLADKPIAIFDPLYARLLKEKISDSGVVPYDIATKARLLKNTKVIFVSFGMGGHWSLAVIVKGSEDNGHLHYYLLPMDSLYSAEVFESMNKDYILAIEKWLQSIHCDTQEKPAESMSCSIINNQPVSQKQPQSPLHDISSSPTAALVTSDTVLKSVILDVKLLNGSPISMQRSHEMALAGNDCGIHNLMNISMCIKIFLQHSVLDNVEEIMTNNEKFSLLCDDISLHQKSSVQKSDIMLYRTKLAENVLELRRKSVQASPKTRGRSTMDANTDVRCEADGFTWTLDNTVLVYKKSAPAADIASHFDRLAEQSLGSSTPGQAVIVRSDVVPVFVVKHSDGEIVCNAKKPDEYLQRFGYYQVTTHIKYDRLDVHRRPESGWVILLYNWLSEHDRNELGLIQSVNICCKYQVVRTTNLATIKKQLAHCEVAIFINDVMIPSHVIVAEDLGARQKCVCPSEEVVLERFRCSNQLNACLLLSALTKFLSCNLHDTRLKLMCIESRERDDEDKESYARDNNAESLEMHTLKELGFEIVCGFYQYIIKRCQTGLNASRLKKYRTDSSKDEDSDDDWATLLSPEFSSATNSEDYIRAFLKYCREQNSKFNDFEDEGEGEGLYGDEDQVSDFEGEPDEYNDFERSEYERAKASRESEEPISENCEVIISKNRKRKRKKGRNQNQNGSNDRKTAVQHTEDCDRDGTTVKLIDDIDELKSLGESEILDYVVALAQRGLICEALALPAKTSRKVLQKAFKKFSLHLHPDKMKDKTLIIKATEAFQILKGGVDDYRV